MEARYIAIWKLHGASTLAAESSALELARLRNPTLVAIVTADPEPFFLHIDQFAVIGSRLWKGLMGAFTPDQGGTFEGWFASELGKVKASRANQKGVFLVFEGETNAPTADFRMRRDTEMLAVCFDAIDKSGIREVFRPAIQSVMAILSLSLPANVDRQIERIGEVIYLVEPNSEKPIYTFNVEFGAARASLASALTGTIVWDAAKRILRIVDDKTFARPASLLITSLNRATDALQAFISAWSALEIFVNANFKATYEAQWFDIMENGAPLAAKPVFERFKDVMSDKYRLADKFLIIASVLDANGAATDAGEFRQLKFVRDRVSHALETPEHLPTEAVQRLLLKYMLLHIDRPA
jgi:hypothetical protein